MIDIRNPRLADFARAGGLRPVEDGNLLAKLKGLVEQHRDAPFRSAEWLAGEMMTLVDSLPAVTDEEIQDLFSDAMSMIHDDRTGINDFAMACVKALRAEQSK